MLGSLFSRTSCLALTWNAARQCRGLRVHRTGDTYTVDDFWGGQVAEGQTLGSCLAEGLRQLGCNETCTIAVGPTVPGWGFVDLLLPQLPPEELVKALSFEIGRQLPVPREKLTWGYRLLPRTEKTPGQCPVRVVYVRDEDWHTTLNELAALTPGADIILPPAVCLDPVLSGQAVLFPGDNGNGVVAAPGENWGRELIAAEAGTRDLFGALPEPLATASVTLAARVAALPPLEQQELAGCLLLALYALGRSARRDDRDLPPIPRELRVRRNRAGRVTALFLGFYLLLVLAVLAGQYLYAASGEYDSLRAEALDLKAKIGGLKGEKDVWKFLQGLENECKTVNLDKPPLTVCLLDMTRRIPNDAWVQSFSWNEGKLEIEVRTANNNLNLIGLLEESPYISDVVAVRKSVDNDNQVNIRLQMLATYDAVAMAKEAPLLPPPPPPPPVQPDADAGEEGL